MGDKEMINDILNSVNANVECLSKDIMQCDTDEFRTFLIQKRNSDQEFARRVYEIAKADGYYIPAAPAGKADIEEVKTACKS